MCWMVRQGLQHYGAECSRSCCTYSFRSVAKGLSVLGITIKNWTGVRDKFDCLWPCLTALVSAMFDIPYPTS